MRSNLAQFDRKTYSATANVNTRQAERKVMGLRDRIAQSLGRDDKFIRALLSPTVATLAGLPAVAATAATGVGVALSGMSAGFIGLAGAAQQSSDDINNAFQEMRSNILGSVMEVTDRTTDEFAMVATQVQNAFENITGQLNTIFVNVQPQITRLTDAVLGFATTAMPGLTQAVNNSMPAIRGFDRLLESAGQGVSSFLRIISTQAEEAESGLGTLGRLIEGLLTNIGRLAAQFTSAWAEAGPEFVAMVNSMLDVLTEFTSGMLPAFTNALEIMASGLETVTSAFEPLAQGFGGFAGTLLGISSAVGILSGTLGRLGRRIPGVSGGMSRMRSRVDSASQSSSRLRRGMGGTASALGRAARAAPYLGAAVIGVKAAFDNAIGSSEEMATKLLQGGEAAAEARAKISETQGTIQNTSLAQHLWGANMDESRAKMEQMLSKMGPLERAKARQTQATNDLAYATNQWGRESPAARKAARRLAIATDKVEQEQRQAELDTMGHTEAIVNQRTEMLNSINTQLGYEQSIIGIKQQQNRLNTLADEGKKGTLEYKSALKTMQRQMVSSVEQFVKFRVQQAKNNNVQDLAAVRANAQRKSLKILQDVAGNQLPPKLQNMIDKLNIGNQSAQNTKGSTDRLRDSILRLPNGREITFPTNAPQTQGKVRDLGASLNHIAKDYEANFFVNYLKAIQEPSANAPPGSAQFPLGTTNAAGSIHRFAGGGQFMQSGMAQRVPPNTWRVIGDRAKDDEAYIPINRSRRSRSLLQQTAKDMGYGLQPMQSGGIINTPINTGIEAAAATNSAVSILSSTIKTAIGQVQQSMTAPAGGGSGRWGPTVRRALGMLGYPQHWSDETLRQIQIESGGNPNAQNNWDINAQMGMPSQGLLQCVPLSTRILTKRGWLAHDEVEVGDETLGFNPDTGRNEWTRITQVVHPGLGPIWRIGHHNWHADVTPNHRWWSETERNTRIGFTSCPECGWEPRGNKAPERGVQVHRNKVHGTQQATRQPEYHGEFIRTDKMGSHHRIRLAAPADTDGIAGLSTEDMQIIGWLQGDGNVYQTDAGTYEGSIYQSKPKMVTKIRSLLAHVEHSEYTRQRQNYHLPSTTFRISREYVTDLVKRSNFLRDDQESFVLAMSADQRAAWLDAMIDAEGHRQPGKKSNHSEFVRIAQVDGPLQDATKLAVYLEGWRPTYSESNAERRGYQPSGMVGMAQPHVSPSTFYDHEVLEEQEVWCVKTELETWTAKQEDRIFLTGNTIPPTFYAHHLPGYNNIKAPLDNILAALRYTTSRYGPIPSIWPTTGGYDNGGALQPGWNMAYNGTGRTENVQSPASEDAMLRKLDRIAQLLQTQEPVSFNIGQADPDTVNEYMDKVLVRLRHRKKEASL